VPGLFALFAGRSKGGVDAITFLRYVTMSIVLVIGIRVSPFGMAWAGSSLLVHVVVDH
jgi:hypothetical protein